jgi:geranylgeranyl transferase type-2 subunit beta
MSQLTYLENLTQTLIIGLENISAPFRERHARYLINSQNPDGGFSGREGPSDLYYTAFGLRGLAVLGELTPERANHAAKFIKGVLGNAVTVVDLFSLIVSVFLIRLAGGDDPLQDAPDDWPERVARALEQHRNADGGYQKALHGTGGSTYTSFLVALTMQLLELPIPEPEKLVKFIRDRERDGGFVEIAQMKRAGTNPTAAGVGVLQMLNNWSENDSEKVANFLVPLLSQDEGGFRANDRIPAADLLSTFTAVWTLHQVGKLSRIDLKSIEKYLQSMEISTGGFHGFFLDPTTDVEYTFYGLGLQAIIEISKGNQE